MIYQNFVSLSLEFLLGKGCRYVPTCSEYSHQAIDSQGILKGTLMTGKRIAKCNPLFKPGFDPVK